MCVAVLLPINKIKLLVYYPPLLAIIL